MVAFGIPTFSSSQEMLVVSAMEVTLMILKLSNKENIYESLKLLVLIMFFQ